MNQEIFKIKAQINDLERIFNNDVIVLKSGRKLILKAIHYCNKNKTIVLVNKETGTVYRQRNTAESDTVDFVVSNTEDGWPLNKILKSFLYSPDKFSHVEGGIHGDSAAEKNKILFEIEFLKSKLSDLENKQKEEEELISVNQIICLKSGKQLQLRSLYFRCGKTLVLLDLESGTVYHQIQKRTFFSSDLIVDYNILTWKVKDILHFFDIAPSEVKCILRRQK